MSEKVVDTGYRPRPLQERLHKELQRFNVLVMHRRFGKTVFSINHMIDRGLRNKIRNPQYAYIAPSYGQAKRIVWDYLKDYTRNIPGQDPNEAELRVDVFRPSHGDRVRFMLLGAENPGSLKGIYLDGVILDEYAEMNPAIWGEVIRPTLSDSSRAAHGNQWAIFVGTPKGQNHFYDKWKDAQKLPGWYRAMFKASETGYVSASELAQAKLEMTPEEYDQEFECSFTAALVGAYYGKQMRDAEKEGRILRIPYERRVPVQTAWDLGKNDATAIWFYQDVGRERRFIDYIEATGEDLPYYAREIKERPYYHEIHYLPHDARAQMLGAPKSREMMLNDLKIRPTLVVPRHRVEEGIEAVRQMLPRSYFDEVKCATGIEALRHYQRRWDSMKKIFLPTPLHNWASNGSDAMRICAMSERTPVNTTDLPREAVSDYNELEW